MSSTPGPVLLVVPAFNEERSVGAVVRAARELGYAVCVVDDGSTDRTRANALAAGAFVLGLPVNLGVGGALRCGFRWALRHDYETVVQVDADGQHDPREVATLLEAMRRSEADMVVGSRFADGADGYRVHAVRRLAMRLLSARVRSVSGVRVADSSSGFRAIRRPLLDRFAAEYPIEYLGDTVEALIEAGCAGAKVVEQPVAMSPRAQGTASANAIASLWYVLRVMVAIELVHRRRVPRPLRGDAGEAEPHARPDETEPHAGAEAEPGAGVDPPPQAQANAPAERVSEAGPLPR